MLKKQVISIIYHDGMNTSRRGSLLTFLIIVAGGAIWYFIFGPSAKPISGGDTLADAEQSFRALSRFKGKKLHLYRMISFYDDGRIYVKVQDPDTPSHIDSYHYQSHGSGGRWTFDSPYKLDQTDSPLSNGLFALDSFSFSTAGKIIRTYNAKAAAVGSRETLGMVEYDQDYPGRGHWKAEDEINGGTDRESKTYHILFNDDGTIKYFGPPNSWNMLSDSAQLAYAESTLKNLPQFKAKKLFFKKEIIFNPNEIYLTLQNPAKPAEIVNYGYSDGGIWELQAPDADDDGKATHLYPLDSVHFNLVYKMAHAYSEKARSVNSTLPAVDGIVYDAADPKRLYWKFDHLIQGGDGGKYVISFKPDGSLKDFKKQ